MTDTDVLQVELSKEQIAILRQQVEQRKSVFKGKHYLESLSVPSFIIGRKNEVERLLEILLQEKDYLVPFVSIFGRSGSGKSSITRLVCESLSDSISFSYTDLRRAKTLFSCANLILSDLDCELIKPHEGINRALSLIEKRVEEILNTEKRKRFVLILDELDVIFSDLRANPSDFVYKLLNVVGNLRSKGYWLCIIAISNTNLLERPLDERVQSRIGQCELYFAPYREEELYHILKDRARLAFNEPVKDEVLKHCAELCGNESGDCRGALELLRMAGELANGSEITATHVDQVFNRLNDDKLLALLKKTTYHQKLLLLAMAKLFLRDKKDEYDEEEKAHSTKDIYSSYSGIFSYNTKPLSYRRVFDLLANLENIGLISGRSVSKGRGGYQKYYKLLIHYDLVGWQIDSKWWVEQVGLKQRHDELMIELERKRELAKIEKQRTGT